MEPAIPRPSFPEGANYRKLRPTLEERFGARVRKVTLRAGFGCPNRDGRVGTRGCLFCSEHSLLPSYGPHHGPIDQQLAAGVASMKKQKAQKAIAVAMQVVDESGLISEEGA